jgi:RND family efflux transporter MFP subunit
MQKRKLGNSNVTTKRDSGNQIKPASRRRLFFRRSFRSAISRAAMILATIALVLQSCSKKESAPTAPPPPEVLVIKVVPQDVPVVKEWVGSLEGSVNANIQARVSGYLTAQNYKEGAAVKKGDLLFEIDPRPFEAALAEAKANLADAQATRVKAEATASRFVQLAGQKAVSEQDRLVAVQANETAKAQVAAKEAAVEEAQLNLEFTNITSPVDGVAGIALTQIGNLVGPATGTLTTVSTLDPIKAYFTVSEQAYVAYMRQFPNDQEREAYESKLELEMVLADGSIYPQKGTLFARDRQVDPRTGALRLAGLFPNPGSVLRPGQFARIRATTSMQHDAILVPQRAVNELQGIYQVAVVTPDNKGSIRPVQVGERSGSNWVITSGLKPNETIVVEGIQKVREGAAVVPKPWTPPAQTNAKDAKTP